MKFQSVIVLVVVSVLALGTTQSLAQCKGYSGGQHHRDHHTVDMTQQQRRGQSSTKEMQQDRSRAEKYASAPSKRIAGAQSAEAREQIRNEHQKDVQARAKNRGVELGAASEGPIYGGEMMSAQERDRYRETLRSLDSAEKREQFLAQHREEMEARARQQASKRNY
jgi:glutamate synthase domain-containing protein 2